MKKSELRKIIKEEITNELFGSNKVKSMVPTKAHEQIANDLKIYFKIAYETGLESNGNYDDFDKEFWNRERPNIISKVVSTKVDIG